MREQARPGSRHLPPGLHILHEDRDIIVVDKPAGMLTMATETEKTRTAYYALTDYVRKGNAKSRYRIFIVHRLDRETSGVLLFAKTEAAKRALQDQWEETTKIYAAVVHGQMGKESGTVISHLVESGVHKVYSTRDAKLGKLAQTAWTVVREKGAYSLLRIELLTGRKHQIRVQMADLGHPVAGDRKYGGKGDNFSRLALHAASITFAHPFSGQRMTLEAPVPTIFAQLVGRVQLS
ncbi:MAG: RNA pseudouridine synthase [Deltaproteobacteria bacterium HGW-Deltaproteobacteria-18]|nr:MAG: RNA pseudouridine synthase [Deltaproteobacteria bacterium HGW-Deltaproteobacteria-20]PKN41106.1 MAG: RNA pseudouridine synthase [Deltaproteobacteria bacterium HGW-Deltaproteobacteria-18]